MNEGDGTSPLSRASIRLAPCAQTAPVLCPQTFNILSLPPGLQKPWSSGASPLTAPPRSLPDGPTLGLSFYTTLITRWRDWH